MKKKTFCLIVLLVVALIENSNALKFIRIKSGDKYGMLDGNLELVSKIDYSSVIFLNNCVFLNSKNDIEIRNEKNQMKDKIYAKDCKFFTDVSYITSDYYVFHGFSKDLIYNTKSKKSFYSKKIASNMFEEKTSHLIPVYTGGYYYSILNKKSYFSDLGFQKVFPFVDGIAVVLKENWEKAVIDEKGNLILDHIVNCGWQFRNGLLPVITKDWSGFIDRTGSVIYKCPMVDEYKSENVGVNPTLRCSFSEGYSYIHTAEKKWMLINNKFEIIKQGLPYFISTRGDFVEGMLPVHLDSKYGYLNTKGELCIPLVFNRAEDFLNGYACVVYNGEDGVIDKNGNLLFTKDIIAGRKESNLNICTN